MNASYLSTHWDMLTKKLRHLILIQPSLKRKWRARNSNWSSSKTLSRHSEVYFNIWIRNTFIYHTYEIWWNQKFLIIKVIIFLYKRHEMSCKISKKFTKLYIYCLGFFIHYWHCITNSFDISSQHCNDSSKFNKLY